MSKGCSDRNGAGAAICGNPATACEGTIEECPLAKTKCPGKSPEEANEGIKKALEEQKKLLEKRKTELEKWDSSAQEDFKKWFGTTDEEARTTIQKRIDKVLEYNNNMTLDNFEAAEPPKDKEKNLYAYVYPFKDDKIYLGQSFCNSNFTGEDSKAGVLCHEMSHFLGTKDHVYGSSNAKKLAEKNSRKALENADNFEYYCEDV